MKKLSGAFLFLAMSASAHTLHYGDYSVQLTNTKQTTPSLNIELDDGIYYAAMYTDNAIPNTIKINYNNTVYWIGCPAGMYRPDGATECVDCGLGHYCLGGNHRASCTSGAIACNGTNATQDATADEKYMNKFLTSDDVISSGLPSTQFSQWGFIDNCVRVENTSEWEVNNPGAGCSTGIIGPGTYLFVRHYDIPQFGNYINVGANIVVFDNPVGYKIMHGNGMFQHYIDTKHAPFESWTITNGGTGTAWGAVNNTNQTNISDIMLLPGNLELSIYELK